MSAKNPVAYAENHLGVHAAHQDAVELIDQLASARGAQARAVDALRRIREAIADREAEMTSVLRGQYAEMSATAFEKQIKVDLQQDPNLREMRAELIDLQAEHDRAENEAKILDRRIDLAVARLHELGGLLAFYASARSSARKSSETD